MGVGMKARLRYLSISSQKARLVADMVRGKSVEQARNILSTNRRAVARDVTKVLMSAVANALNNVEEGQDPPDADDLYVHKIWVDQAPPLKRTRPRAMGRAYRVLKRHCHINVELGQKKAKA